MTECYQTFREKVHEFLNDSTKDGAISFSSFVDDFWYAHEDDLYKSSQDDTYDEVRIVLDMMILCDRFDDCDDIVEYDRNCINSNELIQQVRKRIIHVDNPVYD